MDQCKQDFHRTGVKVRAGGSSHYSCVIVKYTEI